MLLSINSKTIILEKAATLVEIIIVVVIIAILSAIALPNFNKSKENGYNREANLTLKLIQDAERFYYIEHDNYTICDDNSAVIANLKLNIPTDSTRYWDYKVTVSSGNFTAKAHRLGDDGRTYCIDASADDPYSDPGRCVW